MLEKKQGRGRYRLDEIKEAANGREIDILADVAGIPRNLLNGKKHPCPKCGGKDRFRLIDENDGAVFCNKCFNQKNGDYIAAVRWMKEIDFSEALAEIGNYLGIGDAATFEVRTTARNISTNSPPLKTNNIDYYYDDENGEKAFKIIRRVLTETDPKTGKKKKDFYQCRWSGNSWTGGLGTDADGKKRSFVPFPYGLQRLQKENIRTVFISEGEKCVEAAQKVIDAAGRGDEIAVTTIAGGAGNWKYLGTFAHYFSGLEIVLMPDNDNKGEEALLDGWNALTDVSKENDIQGLFYCRFDTKPDGTDAPEKYDVADWIDDKKRAGEDDAEIGRELIDFVTNDKTKERPLMDDSDDSKISDGYEKTIITFICFYQMENKTDIIGVTNEILNIAPPDDYRQKWAAKIIRLAEQTIDEKGRLPSLPEIEATAPIIYNMRSEIARFQGTYDGTIDAAKKLHKIANIKRRDDAFMTFFGALDTAKTGEERQEACEKHKKRLEELDADRTKGKDLSPGAIIAEMISKWEKGEDTFPTYTTGFSGLDEILGGGFPAGGLTILAARPSVGKTAFLTDSASLLATKEPGTPISIFTLEMGADEIFTRVIKQRTNLTIPPQPAKIKTDDFLTQIGPIVRAPICIHDEPATLTDIENQITTDVTKNGTKVIFIDYVDFIDKPEGVREWENQVMWLGHIAKQLKKTAKKHKIAIVLIAQINRKNADEGAPTLSGLRGSGGLEQSADIVFSLWKPDEKRDDRRQIRVLKQRNGPLGVIDFFFCGERFRFEEMDKSYYKDKQKKQPRNGDFLLYNAKDFE